MKPVAEPSVDIQQIDAPGPAGQLKMAIKDGFFSLVVPPCSSRHISLTQRELNIRSTQQNSPGMSCYVSLVVGS